MLMHRASPETLRHEVEALRPWFHNMKLDEIETAPDHPLGDYPAIKWRRFKSAIEDQVRGRSVLDIGCNAGFYSIEMKRLGAKEVVGIDFDDRYLAQARLAARTLEEDIQFERLSVYDVALLGRQFDIVLFMGLLYHLRHPLLALDLIHEHVASDILVFHRCSAAVTKLTPSLPIMISGAAITSIDRATQSCISSSTVTRVIRQTGGCQTTRAAKRCCEARALT